MMTFLYNALLKKLIEEQVLYTAWSQVIHCSKTKPCDNRSLKYLHKTIYKKSLKILIMISLNNVSLQNCMHFYMMES